MAGMVAVSCPEAAQPLATRARLVRLSIAALLTYVAGAIALLATASGGVDALGIPLGFDFLPFHAAARLAASGELAAAFDPPVFTAALEEQLPGVGSGYYWLYPPPFALMILPLALAPYGIAFWAWTAAGLSAYAGSVWLAAHDRAVVLACLAFPAVWVSAYHGQNSFFVAALFLIALSSLEQRRDVMAGLAIALLVIKPHLAILFPLALGASGRWKVFITAAIASITFAGVSIVILGANYLSEFLGASQHLAKALLNTERHWTTISSVYAAVRLVGGSETLAFVLHGVTALAAAALVFVRFRKHGVTRETLTLLAAASLLFSPYIMDYDLLVLAAAGVMLFPKSFSAGNRDALAALAIAMIPISVAAFGQMGLQIGWLAPMMTLLVAEARIRGAARSRHQPTALNSMREA